MYDGKDGVLSLRSVACASLLLLASCGDRPIGDPKDATQVAHGKRVYDAQCASCHGAKLEGQPDWRQRLPNGRSPAPPHDASGHTWHHPDALLFDMIKRGIEPHAAPGYQSDMPAFARTLTDEDIAAVLAYIKSTWPPETLKHQAEVTTQAARRPR